MDNTQDLVQSITTMSGITLDPGLAPRAVWPTDSASVVRQKQQTNLVAAVIRTTAVSEAARAVTSLPQPGSLVKNQQAVVAVGGSAERQSDIIHVSHPALDSVTASTEQNETAQPPTRENLTIIRESLNAAIEQELRRTADDRLFFSADVITYRTEPGYSGASGSGRRKPQSERQRKFCLRLFWLRHGTTMRPVKLISWIEMPSPIRALFRSGH